MVILLFFSAECFSLLSALLKASIKAWNLSVGHRSNLLCISKHLANTEPSALLHLRWLHSMEKQSLTSLKAKLPGKDPYQRQACQHVWGVVPLGCRCKRCLQLLKILTLHSSLTACMRKILGWESSFTGISLKAAAPAIIYVSENNTSQLGIWPS